MTASDASGRSAAEGRGGVHTEAQTALREEVENLQAVVAAVEDELEQCMAEKDSLYETLTAIREACQCPILQEFTTDMVVASDGEGYDRQAIQQWQRQEQTSPVTREQLDRKVFPNRFARRIFEELQKAGLCPENTATTGASSSARQDTLSALRKAIQNFWEARALQILQQRRVPGLNEIDRSKCSVLHLAIHQRLVKVALLIVARSNFLNINAKDLAGCTALHLAAWRGFLQICQAILARADFTELLAADGDGETALMVAHGEGHEAVAELLQEAEAAQFRAPPR